MKPNISKTTFTSASKSASIVLPSIYSELKQQISKIFQLQNPIVMYKEQNDAIEIETQDDYAEFLQQINIAYVGDNSDEILKLMQQPNTQQMLNGFELVDSDGCNEKNTDHKKSNNMDQKETEGALVCLKCYGKKENAKNKKCTRCNGTGSISNKDYNLIKSFIELEASKCMSSMFEEIKASLVPEEDKSDNKMKCDQCKETLTDVYFLCRKCSSLTVCSKCELSIAHTHPLEKIYVNQSDENNTAVVKQNYSSKQKDCMTHILFTRPGQTINYEICYINDGPKWPANTRFYYCNGDIELCHFNAGNNLVGPIDHGQCINMVIPFESKIAKKSTSYFSLGYIENGNKEYFGEKAWIMLDCMHNSENYYQNIDTLCEMGFDKKNAIEALNNSKNVLLNAVPILTGK